MIFIWNVRILVFGTVKNVTFDYTLISVANNYEYYTHSLIVWLLWAWKMHTVIGVYMEKVWLASL